jgi:hypothetical protein
LIISLFLQPAAGKPRSWLGSMMKSVVGSSALSKEDLAPILESLKEKLQSKNVASAIAEKVGGRACWEAFLWYRSVLFQCRFRKGFQAFQGF